MRRALGCCAIRTEILQRAQRRIEILSGVDAEGNPITQPFDDTATIDQEEGKGRGRRRRSASGPRETPARAKNI